MTPIWRRGIRWMVMIGLVTTGVACGPPSNDPTWKPAFDASEFGWILNVAGTSPDDIYAVGGEPDDGAMKHYDGSAWRDVALPDGAPLLNWVHTFDDAAPVAVGNEGLVLRHVDGEWQREETPTDQDLWGIWGASRDNLWAVGGNGNEAEQATILRWRGSEWSEVDVPELERPRVRAFFKVWGTGPDNVYIVCQNGAVLHWDGSSLAEELVGTGADLISLWGTGPDNIAVIGGRTNAVLARWDGDEWTSHELSGVPGMNGIWMGRPDRAWIAGVKGQVGRVDLGGEEPEVTLVGMETRLTLHSIFGFGDGRLITGGGSINRRSPPRRGVAFWRGVAE